MKKIKHIIAVLLMAMAFSASAVSLNDYSENKIADHVFRGTAFSETAPASYYVALFTTSCTDAAVGTEVTGGSYARVAIARSQAAWNGTHGNATGASSGTGGTISNAGTLTFPAPTANWGSITAFGVLDASTAGNPIVCTDLTTPKTVNNADSAPAFAIGALTIQIDN